METPVNVFGRGIGGVAFLIHLFAMVSTSTIQFNFISGIRSDINIEC